MTKALVVANLLTSALQTAARYLSNMAQNSIKLAAKMEQTKLTFEVLTGNRNVGNALFGEMEKIAKSTTLTLGETTAAARQLLVTFDATQIPHLVTMLGNISSGMDNVSLNEMAFLLQTSAEEGKLLARDLRQFTTRGIAMPRALKETLGLFGQGSSAKLNQMVSAGQIGFDKVMKAIERLGSTDMLARQGKTLAGRFTQQQDAIEFAVRDIGAMLVEAFDMKGYLERSTARIRAWQEELWKIKPVLMQIGSAFWAFIDMSGQIGTAVISAFRGMSESTWSWGEAFTVVFATLEFFSKNWAATFALMGTSLDVFIKSMSENFMHLFTQSIPTWTKFMVDLFKNDFKNMVQVITNFMTQFPTLMKLFNKYLESGENRFLEKMRRELGRGTKDWVTEIPDAIQMTKSDELIELENQLQTLQGTVGADYQDAIQAALEKLYMNKKPAAPPGLGPQKPFDFDSGTADNNKKGSSGSLNRTQEAWDKIMGNMNDPIVDAVVKLTYQEKQDQKELRKLLRKMELVNPELHVITEFG